MDHTLTRPSDDAFTRRIRSVRCPWGREVDGRNVLTGEPLPVGPAAQLVAFLAGEQPEPAAQEEPVPSRTRPAGMAGWRPSSSPRPTEPRRRRGRVRRWLRNQLTGLGLVIETLRRPLTRRAQEVAS